MRIAVRAPKDFWSGVMYLGIGASAFWLGADYDMGIASRMGPGYFPKILAALLMLFGALSLLRSFRIDGEAVEALAMKPLVLILGACALFGFLLPRAGVVVALLVLALVSASASIKFRFEARAAACLVLLIACCVIVFVKFLGIPMPLYGSWLEPAASAITSFFR